MKKEKYIIYNDDICDLIDNNKDIIIDNLNDYEMQINDANIYSEAQNIIDDDSQQFLQQLNNFDKKAEYNSIYVVAVLGLWYGSRKATANFKTLEAAMQKCFCDVNKVYFDKKNTTLKLNAVHHDGCNNYKFYKIVNGRKKAIKYFDLVEA